MEESSDNQNQPNQSSDNQDQKSVSSNLVEASFKLIGDLRKAKSEGFNLWAFLFPIGYLYSHLSVENTKKIALAVLIPTLVLSIAFYFLPYSLFVIGDILLFIWFVYVSYLVGTRSSVLVSEGSEADIGKGVLAQVLYGFVYSVIYYL